MLLPLLTKHLTKLSVVLALTATTSYGAAFSTVSPHIQIAAAAIDAQVTAGMQSASAKIRAIKMNTGDKIKSGYEDRAKSLAAIKKLQGESLLMMQSIAADQSSSNDLRALANNIDADTIQTTAKTVEQLSTINQGE